MIKDILYEKEEIVYHTLHNDLKNDRLSQMILLSGPKNPLKLDTAYLLAQSIIENRHDFACEECDLCQRIKTNQYFDLVFIDGSENIIKREDIDKLFERFKETALEKYHKKVFIINNINNASNKVLNMILKYIEEPMDDLYGIFITDEIHGLLDTIKSRCQIIPFKEATIQDITNLYLEDGFESLDAYYLSNIYHVYKKMDLNDELYLLAKDMVDITIDNINDAYNLEIEYANRIYIYKDKNLKHISSLYVDFMILVLNDAININDQNDKEYHDKLIKLNNYPIYKLLEIFMIAKDKMKYTYDRKLILDEITYHINQMI